MPRRRTHTVVGTALGGAAGLITASRLPEEHRPIHVAFALFGGFVGGQLPDVIEPALSPNHRGAFHSVGALGLTGFTWLANWQADCHARAKGCDERAGGTHLTDAQRSDELFKAFWWRALAGFSVGIIAGYASHLALDATSPRGLPLLGQRF